MRKFFNSFSDSASELTSLSGIAIAAMFTAMAIVLGYVTTIQFGNSIKIGFSFLPKDFGSFLLGPVTGGVINGLVDLITFILKPTGPFFPGFTFDAILTGFIMGIFLYKKPLKLGRVLAARIANSIIVNLFFNTLWISILYGKGFLALLPARAVKQIIMLPIETMMLYAILKASESAGLLRMFRGRSDSAARKGA